MIPLRTLRLWDKFHIEEHGPEYRRIRSYRDKNLGYINVQQVVSKEKSFLPLDVLVIPKTTAWEHRRNTIDRADVKN